MWTIGYIHYITNTIAYITYSHVDQDIPYQLKCDKGLFHAWDISVKNQRVLKIKTLWLVSHSKLWLVIRL